MHDASVALAPALCRAGAVAPLSVTLVSEGNACSEPPVQVVCAAGLAASTTPDGRLSVKLIPVSGLTVRLKTVIVNRDVWPAAIELGLNALLRSTASMTGRLTLLEFVFVGVVPPGPSPMTAPLAGSEFVKVVFTPALAGGRARKVTVHSPGVVPDAAGIVPPVPVNATGSPGLGPCESLKEKPQPAGGAEGSSSIARKFGLDPTTGRVSVNMALMTLPSA